MKRVIKNIGFGAAIGISMIIPGVSGGTIAVLLGIYEELISAINNLRYEFKKSFIFLLPIAFGAVIAIATMYFPIKYALEYVPLPTILFFVGLMIGSLPKLFKDGMKKGFNKMSILSIVFPFVFVIILCLLPSFGEVNLGKDMPFYGYTLLVMMGILSSGALVVPGISGSMVLLIFGYYKPILDTVSGVFHEFSHSMLVLLCYALGVLIGFFSIAKIMKFFLSKFPKGTYWAIIGFVLGTIPTIFITFDYTAISCRVAHIVAGFFFCIIGIIFSFSLIKIASKKSFEIIENNELG